MPRNKYSTGGRHVAPHGAGDGDIRRVDHELVDNYGFMLRPRGWVPQEFVVGNDPQYNPKVVDKPPVAVREWRRQRGGK